MHIPDPRVDDFVTFVAADGLVTAGALHVWEPSVNGAPPLLNLMAPGSPTSVPHRSQVTGSSGYYWR